jgi:hypothetical protein
LSLFFLLPKLIHNIKAYFSIDLRGFPFNIFSTSSYPSKKAKSKGLNEVLLTVDKNNEFSIKVIEKNGGKFENVIEGRCLYWIRNF